MELVVLENLSGKTIQVGRLDFAAVAARVRVAEVIAENEHDVRRPGGVGGLKNRGKHERRQQGSVPSDRGEVQHRDRSRVT